MKILFLLPFVISVTALAQDRSVGNKAILAKMDSLVKVMEKKKNELAGLLTDFLFYSKEVDQADHVSKPSRQTIRERINYTESIVKRKSNSGTPISSTMARLEITVKSIKKVNEEMETVKAKLKDNKKDLSEMGEMDMLMLQQMMEKKNQLEAMISNVMKASYEGGQAAVAALKAS